MVFAGEAKPQFDVWAECRIDDQTPLSFPVLSLEENKKGIFRLLPSDDLKNTVVVEVQCTSEVGMIRYKLKAGVVKGAGIEENKVTSSGTTSFNDPIAVGFSSEGRTLAVQLFIRDPKRRAEYAEEEIKQIDPPVREQAEGRP